MHWVGYRGSFYENISGVGMTINLGGGLLALRTYNTRLVFDLRYVGVLTDLAGDPRQHSFNLSFGIMRRDKPFLFF